MMMFFLVAIFITLSCGNNQNFSDMKISTRENLRQEVQSDSLDSDSLDEETNNNAANELENNSNDPDAEEEITAEIPIIISGSYLSCNIINPNQPNILKCKYSVSTQAFENGKILFSDSGLNIRVGVINPDDNTIIIEIIENKDHLPTSDQEDDSEELQKSEKKGMDEQELVNTQYSSLPFKLEMSYISYPMYDSDTKAGFLGDIELLTYLGGGEISLACKRSSDDKEVFSSGNIRLKRDVRNLLTDLLVIDFLGEGSDSEIVLSNIEEIVCEVSVNLYSGLEGVGIDINRSQSERPDFYGMVYLKEEGIDLDRVAAKSFSHNIDCISSFENVCL